MTLPAGARLGPYEILSPLASGGMGEVYRARDTRLDRSLAVKVLPSEVATDPERISRFDREARAASALNHPNIVTVYDVGTSDSTSYLAMELIEGRTLQNVLMAGALTIRRALEIGAQIASGLASAHEAGIVHRDLKPANVVITREGFVKIVDFGLAKVVTPAAGDPVPTDTNTTDTRPGVLLGTVNYMSPEQAAGQPVDLRSDQFSLGNILYEMVSGTNPFRRATREETLRAIRHDEPPLLSRVRADTPAPLAWIVERCLAKEREERFASTRDLASDLAVLRDRLAELAAPPSVGNAAPPRARQRAVVAALVVSAAVAAVVYWPRAAPDARPLRFSIPPTPAVAFNFDTSAPAPPALSPDGGRLVFGGRDEAGRDMLWVRPLDVLHATPIPGTEGATYPFWSPDSRTLGFFADGLLKKIDLAGGRPQPLCPAPNGRGGTWNAKGVILFAPDNTGPLYQVPAVGGQAQPVTRVDPGVPDATHRWPYFLPDGDHFFFLAWSTSRADAERGVYVASVAAGGAHRVVPAASNAAYDSAGFILFARDGSLHALPFDAATLRAGEDAVAVADTVGYHRYRNHANFTVSRTGILAYEAGSVGGASELAVLDRTGLLIDTVGSPADYAGLRLSPDGTRCAVEIREARTGRIDISVIDLGRRMAARLTSEASINDSPTWSPDGSRIAFASAGSIATAADLYVKDLASTGGPQRLLESKEALVPTDWSANGSVLVVGRGKSGTRDQWDLWLFATATGRFEPFMTTPFNERDGRVARDGRFIAYTSDESGTREVYVSPFPRAQTRWQVSFGGGSQPAWRADGRELFYLSADGRLMGVEVGPGAKFRTEPPRPLMAANPTTSSSDLPPYDVFPDGRRFLVNRPSARQPSVAVNVVVDWARTLRK